MIRVKGATSTFEIDLDTGYLYQLYTEVKNKKPIEKRRKYKKIGTEADAYEYLETTEGLSVWKLRARSENIKGVITP